MRLYSDTLTRTDLYVTLPNGVLIESIEDIPNPRTKNPETGMPYLRGWKVYLTGHSRTHSQHGNYQAATWDEWGVWMDRLYRADPNVKIGWYRSREHFIEVTTQIRDHYLNRNSVVAREHRAPWLSHIAT